MLPMWCVVFSMLIRLISGGQYAWGVVKGKARPNPITWLLWGLTAMIAFAAQIQEGVGMPALATFVLGVSPLVIFGIAVAKNPIAGYLTPFTLGCAACAVLGIILWRITDNAQLAIVFSIVADIFASLPTLLKAYHDPSSEYGRPYMLSIISMLIILGTIQSWTFAAYAFPAYMLCINVVLLTFATVPLREMVLGLRMRASLIVSRD